MTMATQRQGGDGYVERGGGSGSLADVVELILDRGMVIDVFIRVSLVGIELLTVDARIVVASVDTYLRFAEATNRLDLHAKGGKDLTELAGDMSRNGAKGKTSGALDAVVDKVGDVLTSGREDRAGQNGAPRRRPQRRVQERAE
jgi:gas vesicle structural protein